MRLSFLEMSNTTFLTRQEYYEMPKILKTLRDRVPLRVFPGNHDVGIGRYLENDERMPTDGCCVDGTGYLHGHTYPSPALAGNLIISGHHHPMVSLRDDVGCSLQSPAYIRAGLDEAPLGLAPAAESGSPTRVLFMPAFNEIAGYDILRITKHPFSPLSRHMQRENAEVILADGTYIGPLGILDDDERD
jgi:metallophosphoesterase superfamily enzyme